MRISSAAPLIREVKVGIILWVVDPNNQLRIFMRHNRPFNGYPDEWNLIYGHVEPSENLLETVCREVFEETGINVRLDQVVDLEYKISKVFTDTTKEICFFSAHVNLANQKILLNEESIGFDWMLVDDVKTIMKYPEQQRAIDSFLGLQPLDKHILEA